MSIHRFLLIETRRTVYNYSFRCIQLCSPVQSPPPPRRAPAAARVAVAGATGFTGQELLRLLSRHPAVALTAAMSSGRPAPRAAAARAHAPLERHHRAALVRDAGAAKPTSCSWRCPIRPPPRSHRRWWTPASASSISPARSGCATQAARARWYPETHRIPARLAYGLTERERGAIARAQLVANPGCYPTATLLALAPLLEAGLLVAGHRRHRRRQVRRLGRGKTPSERTHFSEIHGSMAAYGVFGHRHGAEIEQGAGRTVTFTPHLLPLDRGILATIYVRVAPGTTEEALGDVLERAYSGATFVRLVGSSLPEIKHVAHTNFCDIGWRVDPSGRAILVSVIDNLLKGASGQAVQNMNVMLGLDERTALL